MKQDLEVLGLHLEKGASVGGEAMPFIHSTNLGTQMMMG